MNPWLIVLIAGLLETGWAIGLKYSDGFTRLWPSLGTVIGAIASFWLLSVAMKDLPVGTAYAVWVGIGAVGTAILAVMLFGEPVSPMRVAGILLIVAGITALRAYCGHSDSGLNEPADAGVVSVFVGMAS